MNNITPALSVHQIITYIRARITTLFEAEPGHNNEDLVFAFGNLQEKNCIRTLIIRWRNKRPKCYEAILYGVDIYGPKPVLNKKKVLLLAPNDAVTLVSDILINVDETTLFCDVESMYQIYHDYNHVEQRCMYICKELVKSQQKVAKYYVVSSAIAREDVRELILETSAQRIRMVTASHQKIERALCELAQRHIDGEHIQDSIAQHFAQIHNNGTTIAKQLCTSPYEVRLSGIIEILLCLDFSPVGMYDSMKPGLVKVCEDQVIAVPKILIIKDKIQYNYWLIDYRLLCATKHPILGGREILLALYRSNTLEELKKHKYAQQMDANTLGTYTIPLESFCVFSPIRPLSKDIAFKQCTPNRWSWTYTQTTTHICPEYTWTLLTDADYRSLDTPLLDSITHDEVIHEFRNALANHTSFGIVSRIGKQGYYLSDECVLTHVYYLHDTNNEYTIHYDVKSNLTDKVMIQYITCCATMGTFYLSPQAYEHIYTHSYYMFDIRDYKLLGNQFFDYILVNNDILHTARLCVVHDALFGPPTTHVMALNTHKQIQQARLARLRTITHTCIIQKK